MASALVHGGRRRTWAELDERAARLAAALHELGLGPDSKVAFYLYNSSVYLETLLACFKLRAVPANVNYRYTEQELAYLLENSDAEAVVFHGSLGGRVGAVREQAPKLRAAVQVDDGTPLLDGALRYEDLIEAHDADGTDRALGRRRPLSLYRWHHRHAQGRGVAPRRPLRCARARRLLVLRLRAPRRFAGGG